MQAAGKEGAQRLRMGLKLNPEDRWTRLAYVKGMAIIGDFDAAKGEWERVRGTGADGWDVWQAAGVIEMSGKQWTKAREGLERACALNPHNAEVHAELAEVYWKLDQPKEAHEHAEAALRSNRGEITRESGKRLLLGLAISQAMGEAQTATLRDAVRARAEAGDLAAQMAMAKACFDAKPPRVEEGQAWCLKAAEQGNADAQFSYARNLLELVGERAAGEAVKWLTQAAEQGKDEAQELLAKVLYEGKGVAKDEVTAARWAYLAARQNRAEAKSLLREMELFMDATDLARARKEADSFKAASPQGVRL
jgi:TPR repeat protein